MRVQKRVRACNARDITLKTCEKICADDMRDDAHCCATKENRDEMFEYGGAI